MNFLSLYIMVLTLSLPVGGTWVAYLDFKDYKRIGAKGRVVTFRDFFWELANNEIILMWLSLMGWLFILLSFSSGLISPGSLALFFMGMILLYQGSRLRKKPRFRKKRRWYQNHLKFSGWDRKRRLVLAKRLNRVAWVIFYLGIGSLLYHYFNGSLLFHRQHEWKIFEFIDYYFGRGE